MSNQEAQDDELLALASIYDSSEYESSSDTETPGGRFYAHLDLLNDFCIKVVHNNGPKASAAMNETVYTIKFLPPVELCFDLPPDYPSLTPPRFNLSCKWLTLEQLSRLCKRLDEIWEENKGEVVLFMWTSFLKDEAIDFLGVVSPLDISKVIHKRKRPPRLRRQSTSQKSTESQPDECSISITENQNLAATGHTPNGSCDQETANQTAQDLTNDPEVTSDPRAIQDIASQELLIPTILEYNTQRQEYQFRMTLFTCQVCFLEKLGALCLSFAGCDHVYCKECMKGYFEVQIAEGSVKDLTCPSAKCQSQAHPAQVKELVDAEIFARYDRLLLQSSLDTMSDVVYCPRQACTCAVLVDQESGMGSCSACHYVFCIFCKLTYHGVSPCKVKADDILKLREEFEACDEKGKKLMEKRYGRRAIQQIVEESYTQEWLDECSKKCPHCGTHIEKIDGCNKMTCTKCRTFFCWICATLLSRNNPYHHFSSPGSPCFNKLFQGVIMDEDDDGDERGWIPPEWL